ncbi:hypothetical protein CONPUDRAFT_83503 [Coniophora puteana RWD-64-598 SS2]|uniref:RanBP2-type domain-containing protein n=1 Tax=Coniophora puteana (strain RWD-64-598) TaxID=741705 RepID=A0A5M3MJQ8_CONPW|nr:uncharacterized protein CONPUDRAFT_83503 [Coniophora puteana RWD-64-598 SS2]EIW79227.1 hypothetical protein CONPUDRAFT_83503 [Coniophora puteana RWD-64-598 SS2]
MSGAVRRGDRRSARNAHASPYARPTKAFPPKKSSWGLPSLLSFLNPFRFGSNDTSPDSPEDDSEEDKMGISEPGDEHSLSNHEHGTDTDTQRVNGPAQSLSQRGHQISRNLQDHTVRSAEASGSGRNGWQNPPNQSPFLSLTAVSSQASRNDNRPTTPLAQSLEPVTKFLAEKRGQPLNDFEAAGIFNYIQNVHSPEKPEPFRFSTTSSRDSSPGFTPGDVSGAPDNNDVAPAPRKTLSKNPNGVYRWQGGGSSRPRNRYQSPAFRPRQPQPSIKLSPPKAVTDTKRRRVGEEAGSSQAQRTSLAPSKPFEREGSPGPASTPSPPVNGKGSSSSPSTSRVNGAQAPRLRTTGLTYTPSAPAIPSPLRQTWKNGDSPPQSQSQITPPSKPTKAASFMSGLIKEVTPPKKLEVANPYQVACPVKQPVRKPPPRRVKAARSVEQPKEPEPDVEMSAQAVIEATVPKGSKRSRPPPELEKPTRSAFPAIEPPQPAVNGSSRVGRSAKPTVSVEEADNDADTGPKKKRKTSPPANEASRPVRSTVTVEEIDDDASAKSKTGSSEPTRPSEVVEPGDEPPRSPVKRGSTPPGAKLPLGVKSSVPREPSKLRFSYQAADKSESGSDAEPSTEPVAPPAAEPAPVSTFLSAPAVAATATVAAPVAFSSFQSKPVPEPIPSPPASAKAEPNVKVTISPKEVVLAMNARELPKYSFDLNMGSYDASPSHVKAREAVLVLPASSLPTYDFSKPAPPPPAVAPSSAPKTFDWSGAGMSASKASSTETWQCATCMLQNPDSAKEKCTICEAPRPGAAPPAPKTNGFNWGASGMKAPSAPGGDKWTCSTCMLQNPDSAKEKCTVCEAARPGAAPPAPKMDGFNWGAAGMKAPSVPTSNTWTCNTCMLQNPDSAKEKCTVCEAARPGAAPAAPKVVGFNWGAAGLKAPPASSDAMWTCGTCMLSNPTNAKKCTVCEAERV